MKKLMVCFVGILMGLITYSKESETQNIYLKTDSTHLYLWNPSANLWEINSVQYFKYEKGGNLSSFITKSISSSSNISKSEYIYDANGLLITETSFIWNNEWIPYSRNLTSYDNYGKCKEIVVQNWESGNWINIRLDKYNNYDLNGNIISFEIYDWIETAWVYHLTDYWYYDTSNKLIKRAAILPDSSVYYKILYCYNENGKRTEMYAQFASGNNWINSWRQTYAYNECGNQKEQIDYYGNGPEWVLSTKTIYFDSFNYSGNFGNKIPICHNGHTIYVSKDAVKAHLAHGDCLGECTVEKKNKERNFNEFENQSKQPFTIYPNPAREKFIIKFENEDPNESKKVEFTDSYGKLLKAFNFKGNSDLTIYRNNLPKGTYYIRVIGKVTYSQIVIFD